jgi:hypothetical protein
MRRSRSLKSNFAVFILSHGRADSFLTLETLKRQNYTGDYYIVIDDEDKQADRYFELFGDRVVQFNKDMYREKTDTMDNFNEKAVVVYARNFCFDLAEQLELEYFLVLDDDYTTFGHRFPNESNTTLLGKVSRRLDDIFEAYIQCLEETGSLTIAFAQGGDYLGGVTGGFQNRVKRKAMNSFFCKTERRFEFIGTINEDANTYILEGSRGKLFFTTFDFMLCQGATQERDGGLTEIYLELGTYVKSFYSVIALPSSVRIREMGQKYRRLHHNVKPNSYPLIINERYKKT